MLSSKFVHPVYIPVSVALTMKKLWSHRLDQTKDDTAKHRSRLERQDLIWNLYNKHIVYVRIGDGLSTACTIGRGVRQGCSLSPLLYLMLHFWICIQCQVMYVIPKCLSLLCTGCVSWSGNVHQQCRLHGIGWPYSRFWRQNVYCSGSMPSVLFQNLFKMFFCLHLFKYLVITQDCFLSFLLILLTLELLFLSRFP